MTPTEPDDDRPYDALVDEDGNPTTGPSMNEIIAAYEEEHGAPEA